MYYPADIAIESGVQVLYYMLSQECQWKSTQSHYTPATRLFHAE